MPSYQSIVGNISFNEFEETTNFIDVRCLEKKVGGYLSIVYILMKHPNASTLPCDIPLLLCSDDQ